MNKSKIIFMLALLLTASLGFGQSQVQFCNLDCGHAYKGQAGPPPEYNKFWAGSTLSYALRGEASDFDLNFGLAGKVVLNWFDFGQSERLHVLLYGNIAPPTSSREVSLLDAVNSTGDGLGLGAAAYYIYGDLDKSSITGVFDAGAKSTALTGGGSLWTYRMSLGFDGSLAAANFRGAPLNLSGRASYVIAGDEAAFTAAQNEVGGNYFVFDASLIVPVGDKVGLLVQGTTTPETAPVYRIGIVLATAIF